MKTVALLLAVLGQDPFDSEVKLQLPESAQEYELVKFSLTGMASHAMPRVKLMKDAAGELVLSRVKVERIHGETWSWCFAGPPGTYQVEVVATVEGKTFWPDGEIVIESRVAADPPKTPVDGLSVCIIEDSSARETLPQSQQDIFTDPQLYAAMHQYCGKQWKVIDADLKPEKLPPKWRNALAVKRDGLPWILIADGDPANTISQKLPQDVGGVVKLLESFGK